MHIGHALNHILKDMVVRTQTLLGKKDRKSNGPSRSMADAGAADNRRFWAGMRRDLQKGPPNGAPSTA